MKVFISWSGERSQKLAQSLHWWLKCILTAVEPWLSSTDIPKGSRWAHELATELSSTEFGLICLTRENLDSPWLLFEAGALSRWVEKGAVATLLLDVESDDIAGSPLAQFQDTKVSHDDIRKLVETINARLDYRLDLKRLDTAFELWWPQLQGKIDEAWDTKPQREDHSAYRPIGSRVVTLSQDADLRLSRWLEEFGRAIKSRAYSATARFSIKTEAVAPLQQHLESWTCPIHPRLVKTRITEETNHVAILEIEACCAFALFVIHDHANSTL